IIGIPFRIQNSSEYYLFAWESEELLSDTYVYGDDDIPNKHGLTTAEINDLQKNGVNPTRLEFSERGLRALAYDSYYEMPDNPTEAQESIINDWNVYQGEGLGSQKKRIYKVSKRASGASPAVGSQVEYSDRTGCSFKDITDDGFLSGSDDGRVGWKPGKEYKISIVVTGNNFRVYINDVSSSGSRGKIVCEAADSSYKTGGPGFASIHQRWARWRTPVLNEMIVTELCSNKHPLTLTNQIEVRVSNQRVPALMKKQLDDYAKKTYKNKNYTVFSYEAKSDDRHLSLTIDEAGEGYVW